MKQLTGLDASFLYMESDTNFGHVNGLSIYERPSDDFDPFERVHARFSSMIGHLEPLRRRVVEVPFGLDHPYWVMDPDFDIDFHVRHIGLAPPGGADQLAEQVSRIVGRRMDRQHPLWEAYVIEGLADGRWALLTKTHHATIDGASGVILLNMLTDTEPNPTDRLTPVEWESEPLPGDRELLQKALGNLVTNPVKGVRAQLRLAQDVAEGLGITSVGTALGQARTAIRSAVAGPAPGHENESRVNIPISSAPPTPWNKTISPHRRFAMRSVPLANLKALKDASGTTLNDVVMAICAGALREYLLRHDALPDEPLRSMVPVSIRTGNEEDPWTNRVSALVVDLPTDEADPLKRINRCHEAMLAGKRQFELVPAETLVDITQTTPAVVAASAVRLSSRLRLADRVNFPINVVISNVPGPRHPLYLEGAKLDAYIPVSTIADGVGLNITVHSYLDRLDFGLIAARELVPDLWDLMDLHIEEVERLFEALDVEPPEEQRPAAMRYGGPGGPEPIPMRHEAEDTAQPATTSTPAKKPTAKRKAAAKKKPVKKKAAAKKKPVKKKATKKKATA